MIDQLKKFLSLFTNYPAWIRVVIAFVVSVLVTLYLLCSCGQTVKVVVKDTPSGVSISTTQTKKDSSGTNISINPNINFPKN